MQTLKCFSQFIAVEGPVASLEGPEGGSSSRRGRRGCPPEGSGGEHTGIAPCHIKGCTMHAWQCHPRGNPERIFACPCMHGAATAGTRPAAHDNTAQDAAKAAAAAAPPRRRRAPSRRPAAAAAGRSRRRPCSRPPGPPLLIRPARRVLPRGLAGDPGQAGEG